MNKLVKYGLVVTGAAVLLFLVCNRPGTPRVTDVENAPAAQPLPPQKPAPAAVAAGEPRAVGSPGPKFGEAEAMVGQLKGGATPLPSAGAPRPVGAPVTAAGAAGPAVAAAGAGTQDGKPYDAAAMQSAMMNAMPALGSCLEGGGSQAVTIDFQATSQGKAQLVRVGGAVPASTERCLKDVMSRLQLPHFDGDPRQLSFPVTVYQRQTEPTRSQPAPQPGTPLNIEP